jgi:hypothetical protein
VDRAGIEQALTVAREVLARQPAQHF